jgi:phosphoglycerol transferase MdoB-like AlkP superfamily enzyme
MNYKTRKKLREEWLTSPPILLVYRLLASLLALSISRWLLYLFNLQFFHQTSPGEALFLFFYGMRFDLSVTVVINLPLILYYCFPSRTIFNRFPQQVSDFIYVVTNAIAILLNFIDIVTFHFFGRHLSIEFLRLLRTSDEISWGTVGQVLFDHWYLLVIYILFVVVINVVAAHTKLREDENHIVKRWHLRQVVSLLLMLGLSLFAWRNELKTGQIDMEMTLRYTSPQNVPILLNTPFCILSSREKPVEPRHEFAEYSEDFIHTDLTPNRFLVADSLVTDTLPSNVVVIILKGIGQEMIGYYNPEHRFNLTPFMDSLLAQSLSFDGRSNSRRSLEALPALLAGIPSLMDDDFINSEFAGNDFEAFAQHMQTHGYNTIFMHGGPNGVMGFDQFTRRAGFKNYFGRDEYGDDSDYDGRWGIYDGPFLQYATQALSRIHGPFATAIYMLSSRYPYKVPKDFLFPEESYFWTGFEKTVYYTDCALRDFFHSASKLPWFDNTLFVITSDYSNGEHFQLEYSNFWGMYAIPVAFYWPGHIEAQRSEEIAQQIDLGPSILSALDINDTLFCFGRNLFCDSTQQTFISYFNLIYQYCDGTYLVQSDRQQPYGIYKPHLDPMLDDNLFGRLQCPDIFEKLYNYLEEYNNRMIDNNLRFVVDTTTLTNDTIYETQE